MINGSKNVNTQWARHWRPSTPSERPDATDEYKFKCQIIFVPTGIYTFSAHDFSCLAVYANAFVIELCVPERVHRIHHKSLLPAPDK